MSCIFIKYIKIYIDKLKRNICCENQKEMIINIIVIIIKLNVNSSDINEKKLSKYSTA